jgi:hypothetical protein
MSPNHPSWDKLVNAARRAEPARDESAPYGFATRVAARAMAAERGHFSLFGRYSLRALGVASLLALVSVAANYSAISSAFSEEPVATTDDPVTEAVNIAS